MILSRKCLDEVLFFLASLLITTASLYLIFSFLPSKNLSSALMYIVFYASIVQISSIATSMIFPIVLTYCWVVSEAAISIFIFLMIEKKDILGMKLFKILLSVLSIFSSLSISIAFFKQDLTVGTVIALFHKTNRISIDFFFILSTLLQVTSFDAALSRDNRDDHYPFFISSTHFLLGCLCTLSEENEAMSIVKNSHRDKCRKLTKAILIYSIKDLAISLILYAYLSVFQKDDLKLFITLTIMEIVLTHTLYKILIPSELILSTDSKYESDQGVWNRSYIAILNWEFFIKYFTAILLFLISQKRLSNNQIAGFAILVRNFPLLAKHMKICHEVNFKFLAFSSDY